MGETAYACCSLLQDRKKIKIKIKNLANISHTTLKSLSQSVQLQLSPFSALPVTLDLFTIHMDAENTVKKIKSTEMLSGCVEIHVLSQKATHMYAHLHLLTHIHAHVHERRHIHKDVSLLSEAVGVQRKARVFQDS